MKRPEKIKMLDSVTETTTSSIVDISGANKVTLQFIRADHSSGSSAFTVFVSVDGINFVQFNKLVDNVANTNEQNKTRVASSSLSSNTSKVYDMDLENSIYQAMYVVATETTDGTHSAIAMIEKLV